MALTDQLLHTLSQARRALLDIRPECVPPEWILPDSSLQRCQPAVKPRTRSSKLCGHSNKANCRFGVEDVEDNAGRTPRSQVPVMFFFKNAVQPGKGTARVTSKSALGLGALFASQDAGGDSLGLVVDQEEGNEESVDDISVEAERLLVGRGARVAVDSAEAGTLGAAFLAMQLFSHCAESLIAFQFDLVVTRDAKRRRSLVCRHFANSQSRPGWYIVVSRADHDSVLWYTGQPDDTMPVSRSKRLEEKKVFVLFMRGDRMRASDLIKAPFEETSWERAGWRRKRGLQIALGWSTFLGHFGPFGTSVQGKEGRSQWVTAPLLTNTVEFGHAIGELGRIEWVPVGPGGDWGESGLCLVQAFCPSMYRR